MIDIDEQHPNLECEAGDDYDHCLSRWEDDGGDLDRPPSLAQAFEKDFERDHGHLDQPTDGQRYRPI